MNNIIFVVEAIIGCETTGYILLPSNLIQYVQSFLGVV